jgi:hypothetical protein
MKVQRLPGAAKLPVEQPEPCESCTVKDAHIAKLEARINDPHWMAQRVLALLSKMKGPALGWLAAAIAISLMLATWPLRGILEGRLQEPRDPVSCPVQSQLCVGRPASDLTPAPSISAVPAPERSPGGPAASPPPPRAYGMTPPPHAVDNGVKIASILSAPITHIPPGCLLHGVVQPPCRPQ